MKPQGPRSQSWTSSRGGVGNTKKVAFGGEGCQAARPQSRRQLTLLLEGCAKTGGSLPGLVSKLPSPSSWQVPRELAEEKSWLPAQSCGNLVGVGQGIAMGREAGRAGERPFRPNLILRLSLFPFLSEPVSASLPCLFRPCVLLFFPALSLSSQFH